MPVGICVMCKKERWINNQKRCTMCALSIAFPVGKKKEIKTNE